MASKDGSEDNTTSLLCGIFSSAWFSVTQMPARMSNERWEFKKVSGRVDIGQHAMGQGTDLLISFWLLAIVDINLAHKFSHTCICASQCGNSRNDSELPWNKTSKIQSGSKKKWSLVFHGCNKLGECWQALNMFVCTDAAGHYDCKSPCLLQKLLVCMPSKDGSGDDHQGRLYCFKSSQLMTFPLCLPQHEPCDLYLELVISNDSPVTHGFVHDV